MARLFVSLDLPQEVKDYLFDLQKKLSSNFAKVKWTSKKHLHFTIKFLGVVDDKKAELIAERLSKVKKRELKVKISKIGLFPDEENPRILWVGFDPVDGINELQQEVDGELLDIISDEQRFVAHITIGRVKRVKDDKAFLKLLEDAEIKPLEFEFSHLKLYESVLKGDTQKYNCLREF